jgi:hypothetical protein
MNHDGSPIVRLLAILAVGGLAVFASHPANAQFPTGGMGGGMGGGGMGRGMPGKPGGPDGPSSRRGDEMRSSPPQPAPLASIVQTQLAEFRGELAIEPSQRPAWDRYSQSVLQLLGDITRVNETTRTSDTTAPQRLEQLADLARNRLTATEDLVDAGKALYGVLTPAQRVVADHRMADVARPMFGARPTGGPAVPGDRALPTVDGSMDPLAGPPPSR